MNCICKKCGYFINDKAREYKKVIEHLEELEKEKNRVNIVNFVLQKNRDPYDFINKYKSYDELSKMIHDDNVLNVNNQKVEAYVSFMWIFESLRKNAHSFNYKGVWKENRKFTLHVFEILDILYDYPHLLENEYFKDKFIKHIGYSIPTFDSLKVISKAVKDKMVLEIGSGLGLYATILRMMRLKILVTDNYSMLPLLNKNIKTWTVIENLTSLDAVKKYRDAEVLMSIWPPMDCMAEEALKEFKGNMFIYIGDKNFELTGNYGLLEELLMNWKPIIIIKLLHFTNVEDYLIIYKRKTSDNSNH